MSDIEFINGLNFKAPKDGAPDYVIAKGSIKRLELIAWLQAKDGEWVNFDLKVSNAGKLYAAVDNWKPDPNRQAQRAGQAANLARGGGGSSPANQDDPFPEDKIPFITQFSTH
jgi:hypothetical protein